jgi:hypothetical protein
MDLYKSNPIVRLPWLTAQSRPNKKSLSFADAEDRITSPFVTAHIKEMDLMGKIGEWWKYTGQKSIHQMT